MSPGTSAVLGAFIGASAGIGSGILLEMYRRHRDTRGTALALAGEIASLLHMAEVRRYVPAFERFLAELREGHDVSIPRITHGRDYRDPVADRYLDKIGYLPGDLPERIVRFYAVLSGIRHDLDRMSSGEVDLQGKANLIAEDLSLWDDNDDLSEKLIEELRQVGRQPCWHGLTTYLNRLRQRTGLSA
jgi:hypothetical protein